MPSSPARETNPIMLDAKRIEEGLSESSVQINIMFLTGSNREIRWCLILIRFRRRGSEEKKIILFSAMEQSRIVRNGNLYSSKSRGFYQHTNREPSLCSNNSAINLFLKKKKKEKWYMITSYSVLFIYCLITLHQEILLGRSVLYPKVLGYN